MSGPDVTPKTESRARPFDAAELRDDETIANALWNSVMIPDTIYLYDMPEDVQVAWQRAAARVASTVDHTRSEAASKAVAEVREVAIRLATDDVPTCDDGDHHVVTLARNVVAVRPELGNCDHCDQIAPCTERRIAVAFLELHAAALIASERKP